MTERKKQVSKEERKIWHKKPAHMLGQGLYTGGMIGFIIVLTGLDTTLSFKIFMAVCFFSATIGMALIQGCIEDHYLQRMIEKENKNDKTKEDISKLMK